VRAMFRRENRLGLFVLIPFAAFVFLFLVYPTVVVLWKAITPHGALGTSALVKALSGTYGTGFLRSIALSGWSALIGGIIGVVLALVIKSLKRPRWLHPALDSWSAVASQLGGVGLAFAFIALIGTQGILTKVFNTIGINLADYGITAVDFWGQVTVYLYFQIPLMFLVMMPAVMGLKNSWREAAAIMGASPARYWWSVGIPLLTPSTLGGMLLLFINAFTAYATVYVLNPSGALVPLQIRFLLQGNVITGQEDLAYAIVAWVILLLLTGLGLITVMQRRTLRWSSQ
jgi:putative spermidine/putrescine transport system permease protein